MRGARRVRIDRRLPGQLGHAQQAHLGACLQRAARDVRGRLMHRAGGGVVDDGYLGVCDMAGIS
jgi:hypothetical protein